MNARYSIHEALTLFYKVLDTRSQGSFLGGTDGIGSELAYKQADEENLQVVLPKSNQLFVDIDNEIQYATFERNFRTLEEFYEVKNAKETPSKSGQPGRCHITVTLLEDIDSRERLLLQAFLGSDLKREFLGLQRVKTNDPAPTLFLEKKDFSSLPVPSLESLEVAFNDDILF